MEFGCGYVVTLQPSALTQQRQIAQLTSPFYWTSKGLSQSAATLIKTESFWSSLFFCLTASSTTPKIPKLATHLRRVSEESNDPLAHSLTDNSPRLAQSLTDNSPRLAHLSTQVIDSNNSLRHSSTSYHTPHASPSHQHLTTLPSAIITQPSFTPNRSPYSRLSTHEPPSRHSPPSRRRSKASGLGGRVQWVAPALYWVLRDFHLSLVDSEDNPCTTDEYFERVLRDTTAFAAHSGVRSVRHEIAAFFPDRDCITLPLPITSPPTSLTSLTSPPTSLTSLTSPHSTLHTSAPPGVGAQLEHCSWSDLRPLFRRRVSSLRTKLIIDANERVEAHGVVPLNGPGFASLTERLLDELNGGKLPDIVSVWDALQRDECYRGVKEACRSYVEQVRLRLSKRLPMASDSLVMTLREIREEALETFSQIALGSKPMVRHHEKQARERMDEVDERAMVENETIATRKCKTLLDHLSQPIKTKVNAKQYSTLTEFEEDLAHLQTEFEQLEAPVAVKCEKLNETIASLSACVTAAIVDKQKNAEHEKALTFERERAEIEETRRFQLAKLKIDSEREEALAKEVEELTKKSVELEKEILQATAAVKEAEDTLAVERQRREEQENTLSRLGDTLPQSRKGSTIDEKLEKEKKGSCCVIQ
eukprot:GHVN01040021.1.p1 GENE.GHVN01040021.1~~GHVN01040021.1.p1  ORF type:complete len:647 (-),score=192.00 GHVN01040021.1:38-1978(-)